MKRTSIFLSFFFIFSFVSLATNLWALGDSEDTVKDNFVPEKNYRGQWNQGTQFFLKIIIAAIPIALVGLFFEEQIEIIFSGSSFLVAAMLFLTGLLLLLSHLKITRKSNNQKKNTKIGIGLAQKLISFLLFFFA